MEEELTRLFYVVDSIMDNEEIYETYEGALANYENKRVGNNPRLYIAEVKNLDLKLVEEETAKNTQKFFGFKM